MHSRIYLDHIKPWIGKPKVLILYGARQVGKTSILKLLKEEYRNMVVLTSENPIVNEAFSTKNQSRIDILIGEAKIVAIDEAQKIENIGEVLKYLHDQDNGIQYIATGSSSFDLSNKVTEALTGRNIKFIIYPYSLDELMDIKSFLWVSDNIERLLIYGQYPEIIDAEQSEILPLLQNLSGDYLFQDILQHENLRNSNELRKVLRAVAMQLGSEVSYNEVAQTVGLAPRTVERYIDLLEKNFILYTLSSYHKNLRNELKKSKKIYFTDLGIRNAILNNFAPLDIRMDKGGLWGNFCINERKKFYAIKQKPINFYFWRTYDQAEIDLIEERDGMLTAFEFKYNPKKKKVKFPASFMESYPVKETRVITKDNFENLMK